MKSIVKLVVALAAVFGASASALASSAFLSGTAGTNSPSGYVVANAANIVGSNDGSTATINDADNNASSTTWTLNAGLSINISGSTTFTLDIWTVSSNHNIISASLSSITFTDGSSNTNTVSSGFGTVTGTAKGNDGAIQLFSFTTTYASGGFDPSNITAISFNLAVTTAGGKDSSKETFGVDALRITGTAAAVPEPDTLALFAVGAVGLGLMVRRRLRQVGRPPADRLAPSDRG